MADSTLKRVKRLPWYAWALIAALCQVQLNLLLPDSSDQSTRSAGPVADPKLTHAHEASLVGKSGIQFELDEDYGLTLNAAIDGKTTKCILDTGAAAALELPGSARSDRVLNLQPDSDSGGATTINVENGRLTISGSNARWVDIQTDGSIVFDDRHNPGSELEYIGDAGGRLVGMTKTRVGSVAIGGLFRKDVTAVSLNGAWLVETEGTPEPAAVMQTDLTTLGTGLFAGQSLTLDFETQRMTVAASSKEFQYSAGVDGALVADLTMSEEGTPCVAGTIAGRAVKWVVDTGSADVSVPVHIAHELGLNLQKPEHTHSAAFGELTYYPLGSLQIGVGSCRRSIDVCTAPESRSTDCVLGLSFLRQFRVTLDFGNHQAVFRPIAGH